jgi:hypothetical protein
MYNPLPLLTVGLLGDEIQKGKRWFLRQSFPRGNTAGVKAAFLIRAYTAGERQSAEEHLAAARDDRHAFLYDATLPQHRERLSAAARQPIGYKVFYAGRKGVQWDPPPPYQEKMRHYIRAHHSGWMPKEKGEKIQIGLYEEFGQLFLKFSYDKEEDWIPFDLIEKY